MPAAWRLTKTKYLQDAFSGEGSLRHGGRWNSAGTRVVYASETLALAVLELLVRLQAVGPLGACSSVAVDFDSTLVERVDVAALPRGWSASPAPREIALIGDRWAQERRSAVLQVPSAIIPTESNFLLNPEHPDFSKVTIGAAQPFTFDPRLFES